MMELVEKKEMPEDDDVEQLLLVKKQIHFDERTYKFLCLIKHLFTDPKLHIFCYDHEGPPGMSALDGIMPMLRDCPAETFSLLYSTKSPFNVDHTAGLVQMFARFPDVFERKVHLLAFQTHNRYLLDNGSTENEAESAILLQWLHAAPLENGKPRLLALLRSYMAQDRESIITQIVQAFVAAEHPANFMVRIENSYRVASCREFLMENARTGERLAMRRYPKQNVFDDENWFLRRCPTKNIGHDRAAEQALELELLEIADTPGTWHETITQRTRQAIFLHLKSNKTNRRERCWNFDDKFVGFGTILLLAIVSLLIWHLIFYEWKFDTYDYDNDALL